jgi:hypothetical protein
MKISNILIVKGNLLRSKTQLSFSKLLSFLEKDYEYNLRTKLFDRKEDLIDFKLGNIYVKITKYVKRFFYNFCESMNHIEVLFFYQL